MKIILNNIFSLSCFDILSIRYPTSFFGQGTAIVALVSDVVPESLFVFIRFYLVSTSLVNEFQARIFPKFKQIP